MNYKEVLEVIKNNKPCKVRFTGSTLFLANKEFNVDTDKGILQIGVSSINTDDYIKLQRYCLERDEYTVEGAILF